MAERTASVVTDELAETILREGVTPWPDDLAETYRAAGYWRDRPLGDLVWEWAEAHPHGLAVVDGDTRITYRELACTADRVAVLLRERGLGRGAVLLVALPNGWELVVLLLACLRAGVAPVMMLPAHRDHELAAIGRLTGASAIAVPGMFREYDHPAMADRVRDQVPSLSEVLVCGDDVDAHHVDVRAAIEDAPADYVLARRAHLDATPPAASDVAVFLLSGGTTGLSKVIARTHNDYEYNARRSAEVCGFDAHTVYLAALPAGHNFPLASPGILGTLMVGGTVVLVPSPSPSRVFETIAAERVTVVAAVPAVLSRWVATAEAARPDLTSLRLVQVGGSLFAKEAYRRAVDVLGCRVQQVYGMAEGLLCYVRESDPDDVAAATQGRPISEHDELRIVDPSGAEVPDGESGELLVRGPYTPRGYFQAPEQNREAFTDGWYRTGDLVQRHPGGNLVVVGRTKDVVNRGGEKISADEIERLVQAVDGVADVAVIAVPDPELGERACACVVPRSGRTVTLQDIGRELRAAGVAEYKIPESLLVLREMPQTSVGKTDKNALSRIVTSRTHLA